jgi:hypothetical protein
MSTASASATPAHGPGRLWILLAAAVLAGLGVIAFVAAGSGVHGGTPAQQLRQWADGTGLGSSVGTLLADDRRIASVVAEHRGTGAVHADCAVLLNDAEAANTELPTPDSQVTSLLAGAYDRLGAAANDCYRAGADDAALQARSARQRAQAGAALMAALDRIRSITGRSVPTTTTTQPNGGGVFG